MDLRNEASRNQAIAMVTFMLHLFQSWIGCTGLPSPVKVLGSSLGGSTRAIAATLFADISIPSRTIGSRWKGM